MTMTSLAPSGALSLPLATATSPARGGGRQGEALAGGGIPDGAVLLITDTAFHPGPWWFFAVLLLVLTLAAQAMAGQGDELVRSRTGGGRTGRPPITRVIRTGPNGRITARTGPGGGRAGR